MKELSKAEETIMLTILRLEENAYGVTIRHKIKETSGKEYTYGTLYGILEQMVRKELIIGNQSNPTPERGGRRKTFYRLSPKGVVALKTSLELHRKIWKGMDDYLLDSGV